MYRMEDLLVEDMDKWDDCKCDCHEQNCCTCSTCENYHYLMTVKKHVEVNKNDG